MKNERWILEKKGYDKELTPHNDPINSLGNGFLCCRGFQEELHNNINDLGGIYMAGVFGWAKYKPWIGEGHELVNTPNFLHTTIFVDDKAILLNNNTMEDFTTYLDLQNGTYSHSYIYKENNICIKFHFERFIARHNINLIGQRIKVTCLDSDHEIKILLKIFTSVTNLNDASTEPFPIQPGKKQMDLIWQDSNGCHMQVLGKKKIKIAEIQKIENLDFEQCEQTNEGTLIKVNAPKDRCVECRKMVAVFSTRDVSNALESAKNAISKLACYEKEFLKHQAAMKQYWDRADIAIDGPAKDQVSIRYNIFQLMQVCPEHDSRLSIGARGLSGEMYEACVFWDTEIFMLPFFILSNPQAARKLLEFRYHTLEASKIHAKNNYFKGAFYGWQVNEEGYEQTPHGVGAYYSIHVIADIAYSILQYWNATDDVDFMIKYGSEILVETSRFWVSRTQKNEQKGYYELRAVRGPNEYDVIVNNNCYTNEMAKENLILALSFLQRMKNEYSSEYQKLVVKTKFDENELVVWNNLIEHIFIPYDPQKKLYLEDDEYVNRRPLDVKKFKTGKKRIIDTTLPYEALPLYQVSKQADVLQMMINLPWKYTLEEQNNAWNYYEPRTCFDSSLSYSMFALMGAKLHKDKDSYEYFQLSANLDMNNQQLNTISGLHIANFGGTWQAVVMGFCGINLNEDNISISPALPSKWKKVKLRIAYKQQSFDIIINAKSINIQPVDKLANKNTVFFIEGERYAICNDSIHWEKA